MHGLFVEGGSNTCQQAVGQPQQFGVLGAELAGFGHPGVEVLIHHRQRTLRQVAQLVGQIGVDPADDPVFAVTAILAERHLTQEEVANLVHPEALHQGDRVDDIANGLAHLLAPVVEESVREDPARQRDSRRHQESRPVHGVKPDDVLTDHMQISRPIALVEKRFGVRKARAGEVVGQRVDPHVHHVFGVAGYRHTPGEGGPRDRQVA